MPKKKKTDEINMVYLTRFQKHSLELFNELNSYVTKDIIAEKHEALIKYTTAVNALADDFSVKGEDGKLPVFDKISIDAFRRAHTKAIKACEDLIARIPRDTKDQTLINLFKTTDKIRKDLVYDNMLFEQYNVQGLTLDQAIEKRFGKSASDQEKSVFFSSSKEGVEDEDTICVEFPQGTKLDVIGNISKRNPISFIDENGNRVNGFFTERQNIDFRDSFMQISERTVRKAAEDEVNPKWIEVIERAGTYFYDYVNEPEFIQWDNFDLAKLGYDTDTINELKKDEMFREFFGDFLIEMSNVRSLISSGYKNIKATYGSSVDKRNIAMSQISKLLGRDDLLAESRHAQIMVGDTIIEGTFMEEVKGYTQSTIPKDHPAYGLKSTVFDGSMVLRDIADLDMLDYICQNVDRHTDNMIFKFSDDGKKCIGIVGIDNDLSFGTSRPGQAQPRSTRVSRIDLASEGMAKRIETLSDTALRTTLTKKGLSEEEINESIRRLLEVKTRIKEGKIKVVSDDKWTSMKLADMKDGWSYFAKIYDSFEDADPADSKGIPDFKYTEGKKVNSFDYQHEDAHFLKDRINNKSKVFAESLTTVYNETLEKTENSIPDNELKNLLSDWVKTMKTGIKSGNSKLHGASQYYIDLNTKIDEFEVLVNDIKLGNYISPGGYKSALKGLDELTKAANGYLEHVEDVRAKEGNISKTQIKRTQLVKAMIEVAQECRTALEKNYSILVDDYERTKADLFRGLTDPKTQYLKDPAKTIYNKIKQTQDEITPNHMLGDLELEQRVAELLFLTGISKSINRLKQSNQLDSVIKENNIGKHIHIIKNSDAFKHMFASTPKEEIIKMSKSSDAKELFDHYSKCMYDVERHPRKESIKQSKKSEAKSQTIKK